MLTHWPIRKKLLACITILLVILTILSYGSFRGVYAYRGLARSVSRRAAELPYALEMAQHVSDMRVTLSKTRRIREVTVLTGETPLDSQSLREQFRTSTSLLKESLRRYENQLTSNESFDVDIGNFDKERESATAIHNSIQRIEELNADENWMLDNLNVELLHEELESLHATTVELPTFLQTRMQTLAVEVKGKYRAWIVLTWITSLSAVLLLAVLLHMFYSWIFRPLRTLIDGSRLVATKGQFNHRILLQTHDEMSELAESMNAMTQRFQEIKADLDNQVKQRTLETVRNSQLASVGVLAAGVAHEINNPLASIAFRAEALEGRIEELMEDDEGQIDAETQEEIDIVGSYLQTIQDEAFRCKGITERLLDFSREGTHERSETNLAELIEGVVDMVRHLGKYREKEIVINAVPTAYAEIDPQEIKQVVLNLVTNGLEALQPGGTLTIGLLQHAGEVEISVNDNGRGMTPDVLQKIFEPFFTSRLDGNGNGLGLAITHRIVADHDGRIVATSDGPGCGSTFRVTLPVRSNEEKTPRQDQAA